MFLHNYNILNVTREHNCDNENYIHASVKREQNLSAFINVIKQVWNCVYFRDTIDN